VRWATRAGVHIDRAACAWLIRRHVDEGAKFIFVTDPADVPADATRFDMMGAELSHHGIYEYGLEPPNSSIEIFNAVQECAVLRNACYSGIRS